MQDLSTRSRLSRRAFLGHASRAAAGVAMAGSGLAGLGEGAHAAAGLDKSAIVYRRLGRTEMKISHVVAAWDWNEWLYPEAVRLGINYWHKIAGWPALPDALKKLDREAWYCDVVIDTFEEQGAIDQFEWALKSLGLSYIDSFKLHSLYQTAEDVKNKTGMLRAFEKLKKQGKVKFLAAAQHSGNTAEICAAMIESGHFDHLQPAVSLRPTPAMLQMLELAKKHDVGIIAKKMMGSGGLVKKDPEVRRKIEAAMGPEGKLGAAIIKAALTLPGVTAVTPLTRSFEMLNDNLANGGIALTPAESRAVAELRAPGAGLCNYCGECLGQCPQGVAISNVLRYAAYHSVYGERRRARDAYQRLPGSQRADRCRGCGGCKAACPLKLPVTEKLREAHAVLA